MGQYNISKPIGKANKLIKSTLWAKALLTNRKH